LELETGGLNSATGGFAGFADAGSGVSTGAGASAGERTGGGGVTEDGSTTT
jgi:hypothetical protein